MKEIRIYSDESRHRCERFLLLGGIWVEEENIQEVEDVIRKLREKYGFDNDEGKHINFCGELKWTKVSDKYINLYKEVIDLIFDAVEKDLFRICIMLVDTQNPSVVKQGNIKNEGYFKLLYQLYYHNSKMPAVYKIYPDKISNPKQSKVDFNTLDSYLDIAFKKKFSSLLNPEDDGNPIRGFVNNITPIDSKDSNFIQMIDVVMGGIGFFQNGHYKNDGAKKAKVVLMKYIIDKLIYSKTILICNKKFLIARSTKFNIWLFKPKK